MNNILDIPSKNTYLTSKQWEDIKKYVKNRKGIIEEDAATELKDNQILETYNDDIQEVGEEPQKMSQIASYGLSRAATYAIWDGTSGSGTYSISGTITINGAINITNGNTLTLTGSGTIIRGSGSAYFYVQDGGTLIIQGTDENNNIIIDGNNISSSNAAIRVNKNLELNNVTIKNCVRTSGMGGAIQYGYDGYTKTVNSTVTNTTIDNCIAKEGSAIMLQNSCTGTILIENSTIKNCESNGDWGGTIRTQGSFNGDVTIKSCNINNNTSIKNGGGIYWNARGSKSHLTITGDEANPTIINKNTALLGGGLHLGGQSITIEHTQIIENTAPNGGAISLAPYDYSTTTGEGCSLTLGTGAKIINNTAEQYGGGIYMNIYSASPTQGKNFVITVNDGSLIQGNTAQYGGAFAVLQKLGGAENANNDTKKYNAYIYINGGTIGGMTESTMNKALIDGGAFYISRTYGDAGNDYDLKVEITNGSILGNKADGNGGAIYLTDDASSSKAEVDVNGGNIGDNENEVGNIAINGGAVYVNNGSVLVSGGTMSYNKAINNGGAVYIADGNFIIGDGLLQNNVSEVSGGAVYITNGDANIDSGKILSNIALNNGGAICVTSGNVTIGTEECYNAGESSTHTHPTIESNIASDGGGIYVDGGITTMWCGDIRHNHTYDKTVNVLVTNGSFTFNGGAIGVPYDSGIFINGGIFDDNTGESDGVLKHELYYNAILNDIVYNGRIPESKWIASPRGDILHKDCCDPSSPTWEDLFPNYEFVGWENVPENDTDEVVNLYAIWEEK